MDFTTMKFTNICISITLFLYINSALADDSCKVVKPLANGAYSIELNKEKMIAITGATSRDALKIKNELRAMKEEIAAKEALLQTLENAKNNYDTVVDYQRAYIDELENTKDDYKELAKDYKKLAGEPWLTLDVGLGSTGSDTNPLAFVGVGIRKLRVWGVIQEQNSGIILGTSLPIF